MRFRFISSKMTIICLLLAALFPLVSNAQSFLDNGAATGGSSASFGEGDGGKSFINQYSDKYKRLKASDVENIKQRTLIDTSEYSIQLVRHPEDAYGIVNLRIETPLTVQGCMSAHLPWVTAERKGRSMEIAMGKPELLPSADERYPHYECKITNGTPRIDVPLSRNEMIAYKVNTIKLKTDGIFDSYSVRFGEDDITLTPAAQSGFRPAARENALNHVFYPVNMVLLQVPNGLSDENLTHKMDILAKKHKLTPIGRPIPNAKQYTFYALDKDYNVMLPLQRTGITKLDTITVEDIFHGKDGEYKVSRKADVFVKLPGEFD